MTATYNTVDVDICQRVCPPPVSSTAENNYYEPAAAATYFAQIYSNSLDAAHHSDSKYSYIFSKFKIKKKILQQK